MPDYLEYAATEADNGSGAVPQRFQEGGFKGTFVNQCLRFMAAVIRNLGDAAAKLPLDDDGVPVTTNGGKIGTLAFQDADDVAITGGYFRGRGYSFVGAIVAYGGTWAEYVEVYADYFTRGWVVCDGRTVTNPYTNLPVTLPDLRGRYLRMFVNTAHAGDKFGADTQSTSADGTHAHGAVTGGTALTAANLPIAAVTETFTQNGDEDSLLGIDLQTATAHTHSITTVADHQHTIDMLPLSVNVIYLKRVW